EQVTGTVRSGTPALPVLLQLPLDRREEFLADQGGHIDQDPVLLRCVDPGDRSPGKRRPAPQGPKTLRLERPGLRLGERRRRLVGGVLEVRPDHRTVPGRLPRPRAHTVTLQASADLANGAAFLTDPLEDPPDH